MWSSLAGVLLVGTALSPAGGASAQAPDQPAGLIADFSFAERPQGSSVDNGAAGSEVGDASTMLGTDTRRAATLPADLWTGYSLRLTGGQKSSPTASWVRLPDYGPTADGSVTVSVQAKADAPTLAGFNFLWNIGNDQNQAYLFATMRDGASLTRSAITVNSNGGEVNARYAAGGLQPDRWYNLTTVLDAADEELRLYVDGVLVGEAGGVTATLNDLEQDLNTIARSPWPDPYFQGEVSSVQVYDRALESAEVAQAAESATTQLVAAVQDVLDQGLTVASDSLTLPTHGGLVEWLPGEYAGDAGGSVVVADGVAGVTRPQTEDALLRLPASLHSDGRPVRVEVPVRVLALSSPTAQLVIPAKVSADLPTTVAGREVSYRAVDAAGEESAYIGADGSVTRPPAGEGPVAVELTATIDGVTEPVRASVEVLDQGGELAGYVKEVTFDNGVRSDLLAYPGDRRADALHLAARPAGEESWSMLNRGQPVLHVLWDGSQDANRNSQMGSPSLFYDSEGELAAVASQNNAGPGIYVWDTADDGTTFVDQRLITVSAGEVVTDPVVVWDAGSEQYKLRWTDGDGHGRLTVFESLGLGSRPLVHYDVDVLARGVEGLPAEAAEESSLAVGTADYVAFERAYGELRNTGVAPITLSVTEGTEVSAEQLGHATMEYSDGSTKDLAVEWDAQDLGAIGSDGPGTYEVSGMVRTSSFGYPFVEARADPHIFYNEIDDHYYATGSHYAEPADGAIDSTSSYRALGLRRAPTVDGLADAPEELIVDPDNTPGYGWGAFIWAPEIHRINETWYILVGMSRGDKAPGQWGWTSNMVLVPFTGTDDDILDGGMLDKDKWGAPIPLTESPASFDVSYYEDDDGQGYFVIPRSAGIEIVKATMGPKGTVPRFDGTPVRIYSIQQPWQYGKYEGSYSETDPGRDQGIVEGPYLQAHGDNLYLSYSGGTVDKYYNLGLLQAARGADIMDPSAWREVPYPLLTSYDTADGQVGGAAHLGGGHNSFVVDDAGNLALVYHARPYPDPHEGQSGAGGLFDPDRNTVVKSVNVRADGRLDLAVTADQEVAPEHRTVTAVVTVLPGEAPVTAEATTRCVAGKTVVVVRAVNDGPSPADLLVTTPFGERTHSALGPGAGVSYAFSTRVADLPAGEVLVSSTDGPAVAASYAATSCGRS